jgi:hypothetical protein
VLDQVLDHSRLGEIPSRAADLDLLIYLLSDSDGYAWISHSETSSVDLPTLR